MKTRSKMKTSQKVKTSKDGKRERESEQASTSDLDAPCEKQLKTEVGAAGAFAQDGGIINQYFYKSTFNVGNSSQLSTPQSGSIDQVATALSYAKRAKVCRKARHSTIFVGHSRQRTRNYRNFGGISKSTKNAIGRRNRVLNEIQQDAESSKEERSIDMADNDMYFERSEEEAKNQYLKDRVLAFKNPSKQSIKPMTYVGLKELIMGATSKTLAVVGPAGYGKSTLFGRLARDLSQSKKLVMFLKFVKIGEKQETSPCEVFLGGLFRDDSDLKNSYEWLLENQENVIFLLDGLDQVSWDLKADTIFVGTYGKGSTAQIISNLLSKALFPEATVVYSSREHAIFSFDGSLRPDKVISITGLSVDNVKYLFTKELGENGQRLWDEMEASLKPLLSVPAFLKFITYVYEDNPDIPPTTLTEVMQRLFSSFVRSEHKKEELTENQLTGLRRLSYQGLKEKKVTFKSKAFAEVGLELNEIKDFVIIVPGHGKKNYHLLEADKVMLFSHQIFQEFFSSGHIIHMDVESFRKTVEDLSDDYWSVVTRFVTGLLLNKKSKPEDAEISHLAKKQEILRKMLASKYGEGDAQRRRFTLEMASAVSTLASIAETEDSDFIQSFVKNISLSNHSIGISGMSLIASVMRRCMYLEELILRHCGLDVEKVKLLWKCLKHSSVKVNRLDVSRNDRLGDGFKYICRITFHCSVQRLRAVRCGLQCDQLSWLKEIRPSQINELDLQFNKFSVIYIGAIIGDAIIDDASLGLPMASANMECELQLLQKELGAKKLRELRLSSDNVDDIKNAGKRSSLSDPVFASIASIITDGGELEFSQFFLTFLELNSLKLALDKKRVSKLHFYFNKFDADCCEVVANIVMQCSVLELTMFDCNITDDALNHFLMTSKGVKLNKLDVSFNHLSPAAIERIRKSITVENLVNVDQFAQSDNSSD